MIIIPMAGMSRRFREVGYDQPKFMLKLHGQTLFAHSVGSFAAYFATEPFLFIAREEQGVAAFIARELELMGILAAHTVMLERPTLGQADTVRLGLQQAGVSSNTSITIFNIDTFRPGFRYPDASWMHDADGYLEVMHGSDPGFSYALPAPSGEGRVAATAEKTVISDLASTGLYHFRRAGDFLDTMESDEQAASTHGELYVAPLYNALIARGQDVRYHVVAAADVIFCGTPSQYHDLLARSTDTMR